LSTEPAGKVDVGIGNLSVIGYKGAVKTSRRQRRQTFGFLRDLSRKLKRFQPSHKHVFYALSLSIIVSFSAFATIELEEFICTAEETLDRTANLALIGPPCNLKFYELLAQNILAIKSSFSNVLTSVNAPMILMTAILDTYLEGKVYPCFDFLMFLIKEDLTVTKLRAQPNCLVLFQQTTMPAIPTLDNIEHLYLICRYPSFDVSNCTNLKSLGLFDSPGLSSTQRTQISKLVKDSKKLQKLIAMNWGDSTTATSAFECENISTPFEYVMIGDITTLGNRTFRQCYDLTTALFPSVQILKNMAFADCRSLTTVYFPEVTTIGDMDDDWGVFCDCRNLITALFPKAITIGQRAFQLCAKLQTISYRSDATIGTDAFKNCPSTLQRILMP
jgi:hypothetical protein